MASAIMGMPAPRLFVRVVLEGERETWIDAAEVVAIHQEGSGVTWITLSSGSPVATTMSARELLDQMREATENARRFVVESIEVSVEPRP